METAFYITIGFIVIYGILLLIDPYLGLPDDDEDEWEWPWYGRKKGHG